jgi:hypothetical protein
MQSGDIPPLKGGRITNSAAVFSYATGSTGRTKDGFDMGYGANVLVPMLLVMELLEVLEGGIVPNMARISISPNNSMVGWFHPSSEEIKGDEKEGRKLRMIETYRSSKMLLTIVGYALQRRLDSVSTIFYFSFSNIADPVQANYI